MKRILLLATLSIALLSCADKTSKQQAPAVSQPDDVTQVLYFHGKQRCVTCNAIEQLTKEVVDSLANEKIVMKIVDISKKENEGIADSYEVSWSSLILDRNGKTVNLTKMGFGYAKTQPAIFKANLVEAINNIGK